MFCSIVFWNISTIICFEIFMSFNLWKNMEFSIICVQMLNFLPWNTYRTGWNVITPNNVIAPIFSDFCGAIMFHLVYCKYKLEHNWFFYFFSPFSLLEISYPNASFTDDNVSGVNFVLCNYIFNAIQVLRLPSSRRWICKYFEIKSQI